MREAEELREATEEYYAQPLDVGLVIVFVLRNVNKVIFLGKLVRMALYS